MTAIVVDTSAVMAVLLEEDDAHRYAAALSKATELRMAAPTWLETAMLATARCRGDGFRELTAFLDFIGIEVVPMDFVLAQIAYDAWARFGKGRHPAKLNYGDCFAYALARQRGEPLLFKGGDFTLTDIQAAIQPAP
ncbi:type II toxin-antitoxin system VapC family toxin [uncultured Thiodictyon sp.]|uniref:type II toxin-antitoxin system VapC family toxin n=1 Tax=uncultured Thiodictyon sp. TaxID=1846217 RepID=UPI0025DFDC4A|nr:type II toxin-antitoxin system VapC family toxin [uncultured Thiodictyon sp.]